jgi:ATP-dependent Clp protease ATP-binding subunit ClpA
MHTTFYMMTYPTRQIMFAADAEARALHHNFCGTEHVLLALLMSTCEPNAASLLLARAAVDYQSIRKQIIGDIGEGTKPSPLGNLPYTTNLQRLYKVAAHQEMLAMKAQYIAPEHLLLGIISLERCYAYRLVGTHGKLTIELVQARIEVTRAQFEQIAES